MKINLKTISILNIVVIIVFGILYSIFQKDIFGYFMYIFMVPAVLYAVVSIFYVWLIKPIINLVKKWLK